MAREKSREERQHPRRRHAQSAFGASQPGKPQRHPDRAGQSPGGAPCDFARACRQAIVNVKQSPPFRASSNRRRTENLIFSVPSAGTEHPVAALRGRSVSLPSNSFSFSVSARRADALKPASSLSRQASPGGAAGSDPASLALPDCRHGTATHG